MIHRTFIAVEISDEIRNQARALIAELAMTEANVKWVEPENMHWTIKFLGEVHDRRTPEVCAAVADAVRRFAPFALEARGAGAFPSSARPRTVWIGAAGGESAMVQMHDAIDENLAALDFRSTNRRFCPHLTIGRVRRSPRGVTELGELLAAADDFNAGNMTVDQVVVFSSRLDRRGPTYQPLGRADLLGK